VPGAVIPGAENRLPCIAQSIFASGPHSKGPISAMRVPPDGATQATSIVRSPHFPEGLPRRSHAGPLAASAIGARRIGGQVPQRSAACGSWPSAAFAVIQQPSSPVRSLTGLQICGKCFLARTECHTKARESNPQTASGNAMASAAPPPTDRRRSDESDIGIQLRFLPRGDLISFAIEARGPTTKERLVDTFERVDADHCVKDGR